jgi:hypothetical protein
LDAIFPDDPEAAESQRERQAARESGALAREYVTGRLADASGVHAGHPPMSPEVWGSPDTPDRFATHPGFSGVPPGIPFADAGIAPAAPVRGALSIPLTPAGQLDLDALMTAVDGETAGAWEEGWTNPSTSAYRAAGEWPAGAAAPELAAPSFLAPDGDAGSGEFWRPDALDLPLDEAGHRRRPRVRKAGTHRRASVLAVIGLFALVLGIYTAVSVSGMDIAGRVGRRATPAATTQPAPTQTAAPPTATTGPTPQQILDQRARAAFRAITLTPRSDPTCAEHVNTTSYTRAQYVHLDLCVATSAPAGGQFSVELLRGDGTVVYNNAIDQGAAPGSAHHFEVYDLVPGAYYFLVTFNVGDNLQSGVAANLAFTVAH